MEVLDASATNEQLCEPQLLGRVVTVNEQVIEEVQADFEDEDRTPLNIFPKAIVFDQETRAIGRTEDLMAAARERGYSPLKAYHLKDITLLNTSASRLDSESNGVAWIFYATAPVDESADEQPRRTMTEDQLAEGVHELVANTNSALEDLGSQWRLPIFGPET